MTSDQECKKAIQTLAEMIQEINVAMLTTVMPDGALRSRPMINAEPQFSGELWFFTEAAAPKVDEVQENQHVNVSYASPHDQRYVSISGTANLVRDPRKVEILWDSKFAHWFPHDIDQQKLGLLRVTVQRAEYWDAASSRMQQIAGFAKATIGQRRTHPPDHGTVEWPPENAETGIPQPSRKT